MAASFPPNPSVGQLYTSNGRTWKWTGTQWTAQTVTTPTSAPVYVSVSPPPKPIQGSLWYDSNNSNLNIYYTDLNGGAWVSVTPYPQDNIDQNGGVFQGAIYSEYLIPNNPSAFVTVDWVNQKLQTTLSQGGYMRTGGGIVIDPTTGEIAAIDSGLLV